MANEQSMTQVIMQGATEAIKAALMTVREADNLVTNARPIYTMPRSSGLALRLQHLTGKPQKYTRSCATLKLR